MFAAAMIVFILYSSTLGATYYWTTAPGSIQPGNGPWNSTSSYWATSTTGATVGTWSVTGTDTADFYANSEPTSSIAVNGTQSVGNITFAGSGYSLSGGTLAMTAGTSGTLAVNQNAAIASTLSSGTVAVSMTGSAALTLSGTGSSLGELNVNGGTLAFVGGSLTTTTNATTSFNIGVSQAASFTMSGGTITTNGGFSTAASSSCNVTFNQTGGLIASYGWMPIANEGGTTTMNFSGGTLSSSSSQMQLSVRGTTLLTVSGSAYVSPKYMILFWGPGTTYPSSSATINLDGGTLAVQYVASYSSSNTSTLNFDGGLLQASSGAYGPGFLGGLTAANVQLGGAAINAGGQSIVVSQSLLHDPTLGATLDGGLTKLGSGTIQLAGSNTYTGLTTVAAGDLELISSAALANSAALTVNAGPCWTPTATAQRLTPCPARGRSTTCWRAATPS